MSRFFVGIYLFYKFLPKLEFYFAYYYGIILVRIGDVDDGYQPNSFDNNRNISRTYRDCCRLHDLTSPDKQQTRKEV